MNIGDRTYFRGNEITIITEPYELYGGWWQDGIDSTDKTYCVPSLAQREVNVKKAHAERKEQQAGFARLAALRKGKS